MSATSQSDPVSEPALGNSSQAQQPNIPTASIPISDAGRLYSNYIYS